MVLRRSEAPNAVWNCLELFDYTPSSADRSPAIRSGKRVRTVCALREIANSPSEFEKMTI